MPPPQVGAAIVDPTEHNALALDTLPLVVHPLSAVGAEYLPGKEVDHARPDVRRPLHSRLPVGAVLPHLPLHRLKIRGGDDGRVCVRDYDPLVRFGDVLFQPLVERRLGLPADHLPDVRPVLQDAPDGGGTPALALDVIAVPGAGPALVPLRAFYALRFQPLNDGVDRYLPQLPLKYLPDNSGGVLIHHIGGLIPVPEVAVGEVAVAEPPRLHLRPERRGDLLGDVPRVHGVHQVLQAHRQGLHRVAAGEVVEVLLHGDEPCPQRRENLLQITAGLHIVAPEPAEIADHDALYLPRPHIVHQAVPRRTVEHGPRPAVVRVDLREPEVGASVQIVLADGDLVLQGVPVIVLAAVLHREAGIDGGGERRCLLFDFCHRLGLCFSALSCHFLSPSQPTAGSGQSL